MSVVNVWLHLVFSTKNRYPFLINAIRRDVFQHILANGKSKGLEMDFVNGYHDHCHCLFKLHSGITIAQAVQYLKGESSHWINLHELTAEKFEWQDDYYIESVGLNDVQRVRNYIRNQEERHKNLAFEKEVEEMGYFKDDMAQD